MIALVCPMCLSIFILDFSEGDVCPECDMGELYQWEEHFGILSSSFLDAFSQTKGQDE